MIEAIIWDFGGVITSSPFEAFNRYEEAQGLPRDFIRSVNAANPDDNAWARFERSAIDAAQFDTDFMAEAAARGHEVRGSAVLELLAGALRPEMVAVLDGLKARNYRLGCITNNVKSVAAMGNTRETPADIAAVWARFDVLIESSVVGIRKPDPAIYDMACAELKVAPSKAVFLDDLGVNLKPARALGMQTIKVVSAEQAIAELAAILGHELP